MSVPRGGVGGERFRWYSDGGMFVEMYRSGVLTYGKKTINMRIVHSQIACAFEQDNQSPFHLLVSSKK